MRVLSLSALFILISLNNIFAQNLTDKVWVSGQVVERNTNLPLEYATVSFTNAAGKIIAGGITNAKGNYRIEVPKGNYIVAFEFISYKTLNKVHIYIYDNYDWIGPWLIIKLDISTYYYCCRQLTVRFILARKQCDWTSGRWEIL